ncbi:carbonic anhydrase family protein [Neobacillus notoginsengisoli]|uniref:carbonic anhydrase n=1 Tax=Neobacillus notoginsengisoli TaxID=1578198 RepID=A0A417YHT2_9BACI|nr:carbonic anhydrase family protein [Neobacillus notoginsengisoli]RHW32467.1 carbonic anhydrase family protein [Neobacillus notoginsengisoli]
MKKSFLYPLLILSLSFLLGACSEQQKDTTKPKKEEVTETKQNEETKGNEPSTAQWSYEEETGPEHWGELDSSYSACTRGNEQSPINIESSKVKTTDKLENIEVQYKPTHFSIVNTGHTIQANPKTESNSILVEGKEYKLAQFHFHTPSEHEFNSQTFDMELHLVHQDANGKLAVLGVMIQEGKANEALAAIWDKMPKSETEKEIAIKESVDLQTLLPSNQTFFNYKGSLTTPPCSEEVDWIVFEQPIEMSKKQIQAFQQIFPNNQRPVQPLNEREIIKES